MAKVSLTVSVDYENLLLAQSKLNNISKYVNDCLANLGQQIETKDLEKELDLAKAKLISLETKKKEIEEKKKYEKENLVWE